MNKSNKETCRIKDQAIVKVELGLSVDLDQLGLNLKDLDLINVAVSKELHILLSQDPAFSVLTVKAVNLGIVDKSSPVSDNSKIEES